MTIWALICTRSKELSPTTQKLTSYLSSCNVEVKLLVNAKSIFTAYRTAVEKIDLKPNDIVIMCHDDIEILSSREHFLQVLAHELRDTRTGFIGVAGATELNSGAVWWDQESRQRGLLRGFVIHGNYLSSEVVPTSFGRYGPAVIMDGVFPAIKGINLKKLDLSKPDYFKGDWDFYDIHYTYQAKRKSLVNKVVPILLMHNSLGELVGRDSWHENRESFILENRTRFPITL